MNRFALPALLRRVAAGAALMGAAALALPALAADVDLAINISPDKASYNNSDNAQVTVTVANRGQNVASNASVQVDLGFRLVSGLNLSAVPCSASGAVCPSAYTQGGNGQISFVVPMVAPGGQVQVLLPVRWFNPGTWPDPTLLTAVVSAGAGDQEIKPDTNVATSNILVEGAAPNLSVQVQPAVTLVNGDLQFDVVLKNDGNSPAALNLKTSLPNTAQFTPGSQILSMACQGGAGGASCAQLSNVQYINTWAPGSISDPANVGVMLLPASPGNPGTLTLRYVVRPGAPLCNAGGGAQRSLGFKAQIGVLNNVAPPMPFEPAGHTADNTSTQTVAYTAPACATGDLSVASITGPSSTNPNTAYSYTVNYSHASAGASPGAAVGATVSGRFLWPIGGGVINSVTCTGSGGAVCPASFTTSGGSFSGVAGSFPAGGGLALTVNVTTGADSSTICKPQYAVLQADVTPPNTFGDTNYNPSSNPAYQNNTQTKGNNAYQISPQANVGVACAPSYDLKVSKQGPFKDAAATQLATSVQPGDWVYFKLSMTNEAPSSKLIDYGGFDDIRFVGIAPSTDSGPSLPYSYMLTPIDASAPGGPAQRFFFAGRPGDPASLPTQPPNFAPGEQPFPSGVRCTAATGGAVCPVEVGAMSSGGGGGFYQFKSIIPVWSQPQAQLPSGGSLEFISSYHIPPLNPAVAGGANCYSSTLDSDDIPTVRATNRFRADASVSDPMGTDRNPSNNEATVVFDIIPPVCSNALSVSKTLVAPASPTFIPANGVVSYKLTATNASSNNLDLPRLVDYLSMGTTAAVVSVSCNNADNTGGGQCPAFAVPLQQKRLADGTLAPLAPLTAYDRTLLDFVWGSAGAPTMPANSSVSFVVTLAFGPGAADTGYNTAYFTGADTAAASPWPVATSSANASQQSSMTAVLQKRIDRAVAPLGGVVTYTLDAINTGTVALANLTLVDPMPPELAATNPGGFGAVQCRALTSGDGVMTVTAAAACPASLGASASGLATGAFSLPAGSGLRFTFTAVSPMAAATSVDNGARLLDDQHLVVASSAVNFVQPDDGTGGNGASPIPTLGEYALLALAALLGLLAVGSLQRRQRWR